MLIEKKEIFEEL